MTIKEVRSKQQGVKLKKLARCGYDIQELDKKYKGTKEKFCDLDFNIQKLDTDGRVAGENEPETVKWMRP